MSKSQNPSGINFKSVLNFRDLGGIVSDGDKKIKSNMLFRSANLDLMSKEDLEKFEKLNIKTIVDLRAPAEWKRRKNILNNIDILSLPLDFQRATRERIKPYLYKRNSEPILADISNSLYLEILDAALPMFNKVMELLLSPDHSPILIHCHVGKDRTGIISALILLALGVKRELIVEDYMKSNDFLLPYFKRRLLIRKILSFGFYPSWTILYVVTLRQRNIESVLDKIKDQYGGIDSYLVNSGFDSNKLSELKKRLLIGI
jgi:protein-tyrosine phosphatase